MGAQAQAARGPAGEVARLLDTMTSSRDAAITVVENGRLATALATLTLEVIKLTVGTEQGWRSPLRFDPTDLAAPRLAMLPRGTPLPRTADGATFAAPEWVLYQDVTDRRAHSLLFRERGAPANAVLGPGAPLRVAHGQSATLLATDEADALLPLDVARPLPLALPAPTRNGEHVIESWQSVKSAGYRWFAYVSAGRLRVWATPASGAVRWVQRVPAVLEDAPIASVALVAEPETTDESSSTETADGERRVAAPTPNRGRPTFERGLTAFVLRYGARGMSLERWEFVRPSESEPAVSGASDSASSVAASSGESLRRVVLAGEGRVHTRGRARACVAGNVAHFVVTSDESYEFFRAVGGTVAIGDAPVARVGAASGGRFEFSCDEQRSLLLVDATGRPGSMIVYDGGREPRVVPVPLPLLTVQRTIDGAALVPDGVLAFVRTPGSVRAFYTVDFNRWEGGAPLALLEAPFVAPPERPDLPSTPGYSFSVSAVSTFRERVAVMGVGRGSSARVMRYFSTDGGRSWQ
jgi:hypothetical protein